MRPRAQYKLTEEDLAWMSYISKDIRHNVRNSVAKIPMYGVYLVLACAALYTILSRPRITNRAWILVSVLFITFVVTTLQYVIDICFLLTEIRMTIVDNSKRSFTQKAEEFMAMGLFKTHYAVVMFVTGVGDSGLVCILNDGLAAWRAISVLQVHSKRCFKILFVFLLVSCFAFWIPSLVLQIQIIRHQLTPLPNKDLKVVLAITGSSLSVLINGIATVIIGYIGYQQRSLDPPQVAIRFKASKILALLTESGLLYLLIQIIRLGLVVSFVPSTPGFGPLETAASIFSHTTMVITVSVTICTLI
jgi:hypothetical protein